MPARWAHFPPHFFFKMHILNFSMLCVILCSWNTLMLHLILFLLTSMCFIYFPHVELETWCLHFYRVWLTNLLKNKFNLFQKSYLRQKARGWEHSAVVALSLQIWEAMLQLSHIGLMFLGTQALTANLSKFYQMGPKKLSPKGILWIPQ